MSDYISRQAVIDELTKELYYNADDYRTAVRVVGKIPTANVVEVVRCKDCRKREKINGITVCPIAWIKAEVSDDDYCSLGERADI